MKRKKEERYFEVSLEYGTVEVTIEIREEGRIKDNLLILRLVTSKINPTFEGFILSQKIIIPVSKEEIGEYNLPEQVTQISKGRIRDGINEFLNRMYN